MYLSLTRYSNKIKFSTDILYLDNGTDKPCLDKYDNQNGITT